MPIETTTLKSENTEVVQPEVNMTEVTDDLTVENDNSLDPKQYFSLKRVNSANNLTIPGMLSILIYYFCFCSILSAF